MKKTTPRPPTVEFLCDLCTTRHAARCPGCGIDVCNKCGTEQSVDPWTGEDLGDHWMIVCPACFVLLKEPKAHAAAIREEVERKIEELKVDWQQKCKGRV